jgi:hypothetical protein
MYKLSYTKYVKHSFLITIETKEIGKAEGRILVMGRRERRCKQLLDDLKKTRN